MGFEDAFSNEKRNIQFKPKLFLTNLHNFQFKLRKSFNEMKRNEMEGRKKVEKMEVFGF